MPAGFFIFWTRKRIDRIFSYVLAAEGSQYVSLPEKKIISLHAFNPKEACELLTSLSTLESDLSLKIPCARIIDSGRRIPVRSSGNVRFSVRFARAPLPRFVPSISIRSNRNRPITVCF